MGRFRHAARIAGGYILLVVGVAGLFLPVIQGMLLIVAGAALLGWDLKALRDTRHRVASWWRRKSGDGCPPPPESREGLPPPACREPRGAAEGEELSRGGK